MEIVRRHYPTASLDDNLQWVTAEANRAKRDLTDAEFLALCQSVVRWIGERIEAVEAIKQQREAA